MGVANPGFTSLFANMFSIQANGGMRCSPEENDRRGGAPYQHVNLRDYDNIKTNMTDEELVLIPTKDLNKVVKESGLTKEDVRKIKEKRRTLKNRGYAASCRVKRDCEEESLKAELEILKGDVSELNRRCEDQKKWVVVIIITIIIIIITITIIIVIHPNSIEKKTKELGITIFESTFNMWHQHNQHQHRYQNHHIIIIIVTAMTMMMMMKMTMMMMMMMLMMMMMQ